VAVTHIGSTNNILEHRALRTHINILWTWWQIARFSRILYSQSLPPTNFNLQTTPA
jgi:hypothetical protein